MSIKQMVISAATILVKIAVAVFIIKHVTTLAITAYDFGFRVFTEEPVSGKPGLSYTVTVNGETSPKQVGESLEEYGLVRDADLFYVQYLVSAYRGKLVPGNYSLSTSMTAEEMLKVMAADDSEEEELP